MEATKTFASAIEALQKAGLLVDLTPAKLKQAVEEDMDIDFEDADDEIETIYFLQTYYSKGDHQGHLSPQAVRDGFLHHDWRFGQETQDVVAELCALVGDLPPKYRQLGFRKVARTDCVGIREFIDIEEPGTKTMHSVQVDSLDSVVAFFNQQLAAHGDQRRFVSIETDGDWHAYYLVNQDQYNKIFGGSAPALQATEIPGADTTSWLRG